MYEVTRQGCLHDTYSLFVVALGLGVASISKYISMTEFSSVSVVRFSFPRVGSCCVEITLLCHTVLLQYIS